MKWSLKIGRILGIDVYIHVTFLILLGFLGVAQWLVDRSLASALGGVLFFLALFGCVLLHEYGHALTARRYGIQTRDITLLPIGGLARLERMPDKPVQELWVALAGPAVNVVIAILLAMWLTATNSWTPITGLADTNAGFMQRVLVVNLFLVGFNLLPAFPMDGGRVLRALLALRMDYSKATNIAATIGQAMAFVFGFIGLFVNPMLLFIAFFVWIGASQEAAAAEMRSSFAGYRVSDAMLTEFRILHPEDTLAEAVRKLLAGSQQDFPVVEHENIVGMLPRGDLFKALRESGETALVGKVMRREFQKVHAGMPLDTALGQVQHEQGLTMPVLVDGRLAGLLTPENVGEFLMVRSALGRRSQPPPLPPPIIGMSPGLPAHGR